jgi:hypothetical protein
MRVGPQLLLALAIVASTGTKNGSGAEPAEPVNFEYDLKAVPTGPRDLTYDTKNQEYHLLVYCRAGLRVKSVVPDLEKRPVVLRIEGLSNHPDGPLQLLVDGKLYSLHHNGFDKELFRVERKDAVTTVEFLPAGKKLLKPGTQLIYAHPIR